jgi:transposase-like protein
MAKTMYTAAERAAWVRRFGRSGKTPSAFCREHGLVHSTFSRWVRVHGGTADGDTAAVAGPIEFVRLARPGTAEAGELTVVAGASRIVVRRGFDPQLLREVVAALAGEERQQ